MAWSTIILALLVGAALIYYLFFRKLSFFEKMGILHIKPWPIFGNMGPALFRFCALTDVFERIYKLNGNAKYVGYYDFGEPVIMVRTPELVKDITIKHFDHFVDHRSFADPEQDPLFAKNLFSLKGDKWKEVRNLLTPAFTSSKMKAMYKLMSVCGKNLGNFCVERALKKPEAVNLKDVFGRYTTDVIATCAFGISTDSLKNPKNDFYVVGKEATTFEGLLSLKMFVIRSFPVLAKIFNIKLFGPRVQTFFEGIVKDTMETRDREGITRPDMIQIMMESRNSKTDLKLSPLDMTAQAFVFFAAGFDTTSASMCIVSYQLAVYPEIQRKLQKEVDAVMEATNGDVTYEAVNEMQYLDAVISESMRLYPIAMFIDRECVKRYELPPALPGGKPVTIEPGQDICIPVWPMQRDSKYFPDPLVFDPERFIGPGKTSIDSSTYVPFGIGPRICIGNRFALLETKVAILHLLAKCNIKPSAKTVIPFQVSREGFSVTPKGGYWFELHARDSYIK